MRRSVPHLRIASGSGYGHDRIRLGIQRRNHDTGLIGAALIIGGIICLAFAEKELADKEKVEETGKALE